MPETCIGAAPAALCEHLNIALDQRELSARPETSGDYSFLERLYVSVRWTELLASGWPEQARLQFLRAQFALQDRHYKTHYEGADFTILEHAACPIGRLYRFHGGEDVRVMDISLIEEYRGRGIGGALLAAVVKEAEAQHKSVSIHVEKFNPAQHLYRRLGFEEADDSGPYIRMIHPAGRRRA